MKWIKLIYLDLAFFILFIFVGVPFAIYIRRDPWMALIAVLFSLRPLYDVYKGIKGKGVK